MNETAEPCFPALLSIAAGAHIAGIPEQMIRAECKAALEMICRLLPPDTKVRNDSAQVEAT